MRAGDKVTFNTEGALEGDHVTIGCENFSLGEVHGASKSVRIKDGMVKIKGATGVVGQDGQVEFAGVQRRFDPEDVEELATNLQVEEGAGRTALPQLRDVNAAARAANLRWQDGDRLVWNANSRGRNTGPRVRRHGVWLRERDGTMPGRQWRWTDDHYDRMVQQGKVNILRKGGTTFANA